MAASTLSPMIKAGLEHQPIVQVVNVPSFNRMVFVLDGDSQTCSINKYF